MSENTYQIVGIDHQRIMNETFIQNAATFGSIKAAFIPMSEMTVDDSYQRRPQNKINKIAAEWDSDKCGFISVSYRPREGKFAIVDGQNRFLAAKQLGMDRLPCHIMVGRTPEEEALEFAAQDKNKTRVAQLDKLIAEMRAGESQALSIKEVCDEYGVEITREHSRANSCLRGFSAARRIIDVSGKDGLRWILGVLRDASWSNYKNAYGSTMLKSLHNIYTNHTADLAVTKMKICSALEGTDPQHLIANAQFSYSSDCQTAAVTKYLESYLDN